MPRGRPKYDDEPILLEMARASLAEPQSDWALAGIFKKRVAAASDASARRRLYTKFRKRKSDLLARVSQEKPG